jgi:hypothetical protein
MDSLLKLFEVGLAGATINIVVTRSTLFAKLRDWLDGKSEFFGDLVHCTLCFGVWTGLFLALVLDLRLFGCFGLLDWFFSGIASVTLIVPFTWIIYETARRILIN